MAHKINSLEFAIWYPKSPHCPEKELLKKTFQVVNHVFETISTPFPLWEISFVSSYCYFHLFLSFWTQNDPFLRCDFVAIVRGAIQFFANVLLQNNIYVSIGCVPFVGDKIYHCRYLKYQDVLLIIAELWHILTILSGGSIIDKLLKESS